MKDKWKLRPERLRKIKPPESWKLDTTEKLSVIPMAGQERAVEAMEFGLAARGRGYNLFLAGEPGSGRTTYALDRLKERGADLPVPDDWVYLYNFAAPAEPIAVSVPAGRGRELVKALDELLSDLKTTISRAFEQSQYEDAKAQRIRRFQKDAGEIMEGLKAAAEKKGFSLKRTPQGFINLPVVQAKDDKGKPVLREMEEEEFEALSPKKKARYQAASEKLSLRTLAGLRRIRDMEKALKGDLARLESEICRAAIAPCMADARKPWEGNEPLLRWLDAMTEDVVSGFGPFVTAERDESAELDFSRYQANLFVSNDPGGGAPVVWEANPTYYTLCGRVEFESRQGYLYTDFHHIEAGAFHKANGGFLVLDAEKVLMNFMSWEALKRMLRTGAAAIENLGEQYGALPVSSLRPSPIPLNVKVVLVGSSYLYELLQYYDPEFPKLFKIKASFDVDMPRSARTEKLLAQVAAGIQRHEGLLPLDAGALSELVEWASREAEDQELLSIERRPLRELLVESSAWAGIMAPGAGRVGREHVKKAIAHKRYRSGLYQEKLARAFRDGVIRVDTSGGAVGQINGLSIIELSDCRFGHPSRITANVFMGQEGVVNIEREVRMTGPIHNKGLMTLSSYLGRKYAQDMPLTLSARLAFEQNYGGVEGDSASSTELYCLLSALSGLALDQGIAVTGSVDQFGNVQPVGGVNEKIEGFYQYCRIAGLTGAQGVMIPAANVRHLMLDDEVIQAVREGKFSIWAVKSVDEGIELLTGVKAGREGKRGYPRDSVHGRVKARLKKMMEDSVRLSQQTGKRTRKKKTEPEDEE